MARGLSTLIAICIAPALLAACASDTGSPGHSFRTYSEDGITIAETTGGPKYREPLFTFEEVLVLRENPENEGSMLYRPGMFLRADDGRYYVADAGAERIAVFDENGVYLFDFGQQGYGPGDFASLAWLNFVNGELHAYDYSTERVSRFSLDGDLIDVVSSPLSIDPSGGFIFRMHLTPERLPVILVAQEDYRSGAVFERQRGFLYSPGGDSLMTAESEWIRTQKLMSIGEQFNAMYLPYCPSPRICYSPHHGFVWGTGKEAVLGCSSLDGRCSLIRFDQESVPVTAEDKRRTRAWYDERIVAEEGIRRAFLEAEKSALEWPSYRPFWRQFEIDDQGFIWMLAYETARELEEQGGCPLYRVLSPEGEYLGQVRMPAHINAMGFSNGYLTVIRYINDSDERPPTVYRIRPAVRGLRYP